jgi:hypothetical protein
MDSADPVPRPRPQNGATTFERQADDSSAPMIGNARTSMSVGFDR